MVGKNTRIFAPVTIALAVGLAACGGSTTETEAAALVADETEQVNTPSTDTQAPASDTSDRDATDGDSANNDSAETAVAEDVAEPAAEQQAPPVGEQAESVAEQAETIVEQPEPIVNGISLAQVAENTAEIEASRFTMDVRVVGDLEGTPLDANMTITSAQDADGDVEAVIDFSDFFETAFAALPEDERAASAPFIDAFSAPTEARVVDGVSYSRSGFISIFVGHDASTWLIDDGSLEEFDPNLGSEDIATDFLDGFADSEPEVTEVGPDQIDGTDVTQYRAQIDPAAIEDFELSATALDIDRTATLPFDFWVDDDGQLRQFATTIEGSLLEDGSSDGLESIEMVGRWTDIDGGFDIVAPDGAISVDEAIASSDGGLFGDLFTEETFTEPAE